MRTKAKTKVGRSEAKGPGRVHRLARVRNSIIARTQAYPPRANEERD